MNFKFSKKTMCIFVLLMVFISLGTVSAMEVNSTDDNVDSPHDQLKVDNDDEKLSILNDGNYLSSAETFNGTTFSELGTKINSLNDGDVLDLTSNVTQDGDSEITISKSITINGNGITIDAKGKSRIFNISSDATVVLNNLTFTNGYHIKQGGAINIENGVVTITSSQFIKNSAKDEGGAIYFNVDGTVINCNFANNSAELGCGAIDFERSGTVINSNFTNNNATEIGAIYFYVNGTVINCNFVNNSAKLCGAIEFEYAGTVTNCTFTNNTASEYVGGAIYFERNGTVTNCIFTNNTASNSGGAIYFYGDGTVINCNFKNNSAEFAGAIDIQRTGSVINCNFIDNSATYKGGAVYFSSDSEVSNCNFTNNSAKSEGGAVYFYVNGNVSNCNFTQNTARDGGAVYFYEVDGNVTNCIFDRNSADSGGAIFCYDGWDANADTCIFKSSSDSTFGTRILSPVLDVDNFVALYNSGDKLTFDLKTNSSIPVTNGNISISVYFKDNNSWVGNYSCLSGEGWIPELTTGEYYAIFDTEYAEFKPINRTIKIIYSVYVNSCITNNKTVNITAKSYIPHETVKGKLVFILPNGTKINATYAGNGTWWALHTFDDYAVYRVNASYDGLDNVTAYAGTIAVTAPEHTFWYLNYTINNNDNPIIELSNDFYFDLEYDVAFTDGVVITRPVIINGNGYTIDAKGKARIFYVNANDVVLENITFINGNTTDDGGAVYFKSNGKVTDCNFTGNTANEKGGAVWMNYGSVENCNFVNNSAGYEGNIFMNTGSIKNCNFTGNSAEFGGVVYFDRSGTVTDCNFTGNTANDGGAVYFRSGTGTVTNCYFVNNSATSSGGAISFSSGSVENCNFTGNYAQNGGAVYFYNAGNMADCNFIGNYAQNGGAVYFNNAGNMADCNFTGNTATTGSAIYFYSTSASKTVSNSCFLNNRANADETTPLNATLNGNTIEIIFRGQNNLLNAIYSNGDVSFTNVSYWGVNGISNTGSLPITPSRSNKEAGQNITIEIHDVNGGLIDNVTLVSDENGQVIYDYVRLDNGNYTYKAYRLQDQYYASAQISGEFDLDLGDFNRLQAYINRADENSVFTLSHNYTFTVGKDENLIEGIVIDKTITINGNGYAIDAKGKGRVFNVTGSDVILENITFINGNTTNDGGAVYFNGNGAVTDCNFTSNTGGAIWFNGAGNVSDCYFVNNSATSNGGTVYFNGDGAVTDCYFVNNSATGNGGAVRIGRGTVSNCNFTGNSGGAIWFNGDGAVSDCYFVKNSATGNGGVVYFNSIGAVIDCNFTGNTGGAIRFNRAGNVADCNFTDNAGGAIRFNGAGNVTDCNFTGNSGGAIYFSTNSEVSNCNFTGNTGRAVYFNGNGAVTNCNFTSNSATDNGGAVYFRAYGTVSDCYFVKNSATGNGGAVYFYVNGAVTDCNFSGNTARNEGGAVYFWRDGTVSNCNFNNNYASSGGGAIRFSTGTGTVTNCNFVNNCATDKESWGGAINMGSGTVSNCNFTNNKADYGGAIRFSGTGTVTNCNFTNNKATYYSGAIRFSGTGTVTNCNFTNNKATEYGGAIRFSGTGTVTNCNFTNNSATSGGAVYFNEKGTVKNCNFTNNSVSSQGGAIRFSGTGTVTNCNFTGNTAKQNGGAVYFVSTSNVADCSFTGNNATTGSAIYLYSTSASKTVSNSCFLNNKANAEVLDVVVNENNITIIFKGKDNLLNAIYSSSDVTCANVTYWGVNGIANTGSSSVKPSRSNMEAGQKMDVVVVVDYDLIYNDVCLTDENGTIVLPVGVGDNYFVSVLHDEDSYYTKAEKIVMNFTVNVTSQATHNKTVNLTAKSNTFNEIMPELLFILPNGTSINATYGANGTWWAVHTFDDYDVYQLSASYVGLNGVTVNKGTITITKADSIITLENITLNYGENINLTITTEGATGITAKIDNVNVDVENKFTVLISGLNGGNHTLTVSTVPDEDHMSVTETAAIIVNKLPTEIIPANETLDLKAMDIGHILAKLTPEGSGNLTYVSSDVSVVTVDDKGNVNAISGGNATIIVSFAGNDNYTAAKDTVVNVCVSKLDTALDVDISVDENNVIITAAIDKNAGGLIKFNIGGKVVYVDVNDGEAVYDIILPSGNYTVEATYMGDNKFNSNTTSKEFTVAGHVKKNTPITAEAKPGVNRVTIAVNVDENATGFVNIKFADNEFNVALTDGAGSLTVNLPANSYSVDVTYLGDVNFNENMTQLSFTVADPVKENTTIALNVYSFENNATFTVSVNSDATGIMRFEVSGAENYTVYADVLNGKAVMDDVLLSGDYTVVATYLGDSRFNSNITSESFSIKGHVKKDTQISADAKVSGNRVIITVDVDENATGFVGLKLLGSTVYVPVENGVASYVATFDAGTYNVEVTYVGDDDFNENTTRVLFTVVEAAKENTFITLNVSSVENNATFTVDISPDATGIVRFEVSGAENYTVYADVLNGKAVMDDVLLSGDYTVVVTYLGDSRFNSNITSESFSIKGHVKKDTQISADAKVSGNRVIITVDVDENATGFVGLKLLGSTVYVPVENGVASYVATFDAGTYNVEVTYVGDDDFNENTTRVLFTVVEAAKENTFIALNVSSVENNATFTVDVSPDATGIVRFEVSGAENYTVYTDVLNGKAVVDDVLLSGDYTVVVTYMGDSRFNSNATSGSFNVKGHVKKDTPVSANVSINGNKVTIAVNVDENATGFVNIKFADNEFNVALNGGAGSLTVNLPASSYSVDVTYLGDDNFNANMTKLSFTVSDPVKENTAIALDVSSFENNATFTVNLNSDATGIVRFEVSGAEVYTVYADVLNGKAVMDDVLSSGDYSVVVTYLGDSRFNSNITSESFSIKGHVKKDTQISADAKVSGNRVTISINVDENATGFVGLKLLGSTVYVPVENGVASYVNMFAAGSYNVEVTYVGDDDFNENTTRVLFTVVEAAKENTFIALNVSSVENNVTFTVDVSPDATGIVRFEVSGAENYTVYADVLNGKAVMEDVLTVGDYTVVVTYMGDSRFNSNATSGSFNVKGHIKKDTPVSADVSMNGNKVTIAVNVDENATGFVNIKFADNEFNVALNGGAGSLTVNLPANSYSVDVTYLGDDDFNGNVTKLSFTVADPVKENTAINLVVSSVENNATFTVNLNSDAIGIVRFEVSGAEEYTVYADVIDGKAVMEDVLVTGDYTVVATYLGDSRFNSNITFESFTIKGHVKKDTQISADAKVSGNRVTITVGVDENATGFVGLKLLGSTVYVPVESGVASYVNMFAVGSYNVEVTYVGDVDFNENSTSVLFAVVEAAKENTSIALDVSSFENNATFTVNVSPDATGIVRFEVSGAENYTVYADVIDGKAVMEDVLTVGDYAVVATYMGDSRFNSNATSRSFTIKGYVKKDTPISADVKVSGNRVTITVNVDENATGFVNIKFVDNEFNVALTDGAGSLTVNLPASSYSVDVAYIGDDNFNGNVTKLSFTVSDPVKENTTIALVVSSVENNATFIVNLNSDATGIVRFEVSGAEVYTVYADVIDGKAVMEDVLSVGDYTVVATYLGDSRFNSNITSESFSIKGHIKKDTPISADAKVSGNRVTITVGVDENATGFVGLKLLGSTIYVPVESGVATYINTFATGSYNVEVTYVGDDDFNENTTRVLFTVVEAAKKNTPIALDVSSFENNATFAVDVDSDATGIVRFEVSGAENYTVYADVVDGRAVMRDVLSAGEYSVVATYMGDSKFNTNSTTSSFTILDHVKIDTQIKAVPTVDGNTVTITATVDSNATGFVTFGVLGQRFMIPVNDGKAVFTFDFASGTYAANVVYLGDDNFNNASTTATFTVIKQVVELKNTTLDVNVDSVENDVSIIAKVDTLASGLVEFVIDGEAVYIAVNNGEAVYNVVLPAGDYNVTVTYLGDGKFNPNSTVKAFTVVDHIKKNTTMASDVVLDGNNVTLTVSVNKDASGFVKFTLGGRNVFAEVVDGKAVINVIVSAGDYEVAATYMGDDEFNENATVISFTVEAPESSDVTIHVPSDVKAGESTNVTVDIANATGNVTVIVDGKETTVPLVNGSASVALENISAGDHSVVVVYSGDETHAPTHSSSTFSVPEDKVIQPVVTGFVDITIFSDSTVSAVLADEMGKAIANATVTYSVGSISGSVVTDSNGMFTIKCESGVVMAISYAGDADYLATNTTIKFDNVVPAVRQSTVIVGNNYTQYAVEYYAGERGQNFTVQLKDANGNVLANKEVLIGYNGKTLYRTTNATGHASVQINLKDKNRLTFAVTFLGDKDYNATMSVYLITINQKPVTITAAAKSYKATAKTKKYTVTLKTIKGASANGKIYFAAGKKVTMKINGKTYTAKTNAKGQATFSLKITKKGKFAASIKYAGDNTYKAASKSVKITIK